MFIDFRKDWQKRVRVHFDQVRHRKIFPPPENIVLPKMIFDNERLGIEEGFFFLCLNDHDPLT